MSYSVRLISSREVARGTRAFLFERPAEFSFKAGQSLDMTLVDPPETDAEGNTRAFSIASAPHEPHLMVATRMRDTAFKRVLGELATGTEVTIDGPFGNLLLHNNPARPAVIIAGGIGITPFRSMLARATHEKLPHRLLLLYSNRRPEDAAFLDELEAWAKENRNLRLVATMTQADGVWSGERGIINQAMLERYRPQGMAIYYLAGPPGMVAAMHNLLNGAGVDDDDIRLEEFSGY